MLLIIGGALLAIGAVVALADGVDQLLKWIAVIFWFGLFAIWIFGGK